MFNAVSPAVSSVLKLEGVEGEAAVAELIERGRKEGFPLVEKDSLFPNYVFATFFFTDTARWHDVELEVFGIYDEYGWGTGSCTGSILRDFITVRICFPMICAWLTGLSYAIR